MSYLIKKNVSTRSYNFETARSFIIDEERHVSYFLKGRLTEIWEVIVKAKNYTEIEEYAISHNFKNKLIPFLCELKEKNLINFDINSQIPESNFIDFTIKHTDKNYAYYRKRCENLILSHNLINQLYLQLTYKCNLNCRHCLIEKGACNEEIYFETAKEIIDRAYELGINNIRISGGECTCCKDFLKIVKYIRKKHLSYSFVTNGQMLFDNKELFNEIVESYPNNVKISLYSMDEKVHDYITGVEGSQYKALNVIKRLRENNINVVIASIQLTLNKGSYKDIKNFSEEINAQCVCDTLLINNLDNSNMSMRLTEEEMEKLYLDRNFPNNAYNKQRIKKFDTCGNICEAGYLLINVMPNLDITPCVNLKYKLGNLKTDSLNKIWNESVPIFREKFSVKNLTHCTKEKYCKYCNYCPVITMHYGDFTGKADILCDDAIAYYNALEKIKSEI